jgi:hypothetical protein
MRFFKKDLDLEYRIINKKVTISLSENNCFYRGTSRFVVANALKMTKRAMIVMMFACDGCC